MSLLTTILLSGASGAVISSILNFLFQVYFEKRKSEERNLFEIKENDKIIIQELYGPIYNILGEDIIPGDGYEGLDPEQLNRIRDLIDKFPHLVDTKLDSITYSFSEDLIFMHQNRKEILYYEKIFDNDNKLKDHVSKTYNQKKRNLNLPYNEDLIN